MYRAYLLCLASLFFTKSLCAQVNSYPYTQNFEGSFVEGVNLEFLANWWGNDVRSSSRIYPNTATAYDGSQALAAIPTSTYDAEIILRANFWSIVHPQVRFFAGSDANGATSTRPSLLYLSWSVDSGQGYSPEMPIGDETSFPNQPHGGYLEYVVDLPDSLANAGVLLKWRVARGEGSGSAAKWLMDAVTVTDGGPRLSTVSVSDEHSLNLEFDVALDSMVAVNPNRYQLSEGTSLVQAVSWQPNNPRDVTLTVDTLVDGSQWLIAEGVKSSNGFVRERPDSIYFNYLHLAVDSLVITEDSVLWLRANQPLANLESVLSLQGHVAQTVDSLAGNTWQVTFSPALSAGDSLNISLSGLKNTTGNSTLTQSWVGVYTPTLRVVDVSVLDHQRVALEFNLPLDSTTALAQTNYLRQTDARQVSAVTWQETEPRKVIITWPEVFMEGEFDLAISNLESADGQANFPSPTLVHFAYLPLQLLEFGVADSHSLWLRFNQPMDGAGIARTKDEMGLADSIILRQDSLLAIWALPWVNNFYEVELEGLINESGNAQLDTTIGLFHATETAEGALVINEIFADPNPKAISPDSLIWPVGSEGEFVEIYNPGPRSYNLAGMQLSGRHLDSIAIDVGEYVVLAADGSLYPNGHTVAGWNGLSNGGEAVWLSGSSGHAIDSVFFSDSWYQDAGKNGGWSLERIHPTKPCSDASNWRASVNSTGATPGLENSVLDLMPDTEAPTWVSVENHFPDSLIMQFSEIIRANITDSVAMFSPSLANHWRLDERELVVIPEGNPAANIMYTLLLPGVADCAGNAFQDTLTLVWDTLAPEVLEVFASDWQELTLIANEPIQGAQAIRVSNELLFSDTIWQGNKVLLRLAEPMPIQDTLWVVWEGLADTKGNATGRDSMLVWFNSAIDTAIALTGQLTRVTFHEGLLADSAGVLHNFLLNGQHPTSVVFHDDPLRNLTLVWPTELKADRTYTLQTQNIYSVEGIRLVTPTADVVWDQQAPQLDSVWALSPTESWLEFDEPVDLESTLRAGNYLRQPDEVRPVSVTKISPQRIHLAWDAPMVSEREYTLEVRGVADVWGNTPSRARTHLWAWDTVAPALQEIVPVGDSLLRFSFSEPLQALFEMGMAVGLDSIWHREDASAVWYGRFAHPLPDTIMLSLRAIDHYRNVDTLNAMVISTKPVWIRSHLLSSTEARLEAYPAHAEQALTMASFSVAGRDIVAWEEMEEGYRLEWGTPISAGDSIFVMVQDADLSDTLLLIYQPQNPKIQWLSPQLLEFTWEESLAGFPRASPAGHWVLPDNLVPSQILRPDDYTEQWLLKDSLRDNQAYQLSLPYRWDGWERLWPAQEIAFFRDTEAPRLDSIWVAGRKTLGLAFSEPAILGEENLGLGGLDQAPAKVQRIGPDRYLATWAEDLPTSLPIWIHLSEVSDSVGNYLTSDSVSLEIYPWISPSENDVLFTEIMADPSPSQGLPEIEYLELWNTSDSSYWTEGWRLTDATGGMALPARWWPAQTRVVLCPASTDPAVFGDSVQVWNTSGFPSLNNSGELLQLWDYSGQLLAVVDYLDDWHTQPDVEGGRSLERMEESPPCGVPWATSLSPVGGTPGLPNTLSGWIGDSIAPTIISAGLMENRQVSIGFSEPLDTLLMPTISVGQYVVTSQSYVQAGQGMLVNFAPALDSGNTLIVEVSDFQDCHGNVGTDTTLNLRMGKTPGFQELLITEIRPHPTEVVSLPEVEYIEVSNPTQYWLSLGGVGLEDDSKRVTLPPYTMAPGERLVLTSTGSAALFSVPSLGVPSWPSLSRSGETVRLYTPNGQPIHQVQYPDDWFGSADPGVSWEMIDAAFPCRDADNWAPSTDAAGGTPGFANAVAATRPDQTAPELLRAVVVDSMRLRAQFSEPLWRRAATRGTIMLSPNPGIDSVTFAWETPNWLDLALHSPMELGQLYTLEVRQVADCSGNVDFDPQAVTFARPESAKKGDVILNEFLFDPAAGGADFVELFNTSNRYLDLTDWRLGTDTSHYEGALLGQMGFGAPLEPGGYRVLTADAQAIRQTHLKVPLSTIWELPGMENLIQGEGQIALWTRDGLRMDAVAYQEDWHSSLLGSVKGVSLERLQAEATTQEAKNWTSAAASKGFATPGTINSQSAQAGIDTMQVLWAEPRAFNPRSSFGQNFSQLGYSMPSAGYFATVTVYDAQGYPQKKLAQNELLATEGWWRWDGLSDTGQLLPAGIYWVKGVFFHPDGARFTATTRVVIAAEF